MNRREPAYKTLLQVKQSFVGLDSWLAMREPEIVAAPHVAGGRLGRRSDGAFQRRATPLP